MVIDCFDRRKLGEVFYRPRGWRSKYDAEKKKKTSRECDEEETWEAGLVTKSRSIRCEETDRRSGLDRAARAHKLGL